MSKKPNWKLRPESYKTGKDYDDSLSQRSVIPPTYHSTTFSFDSAEDGEKRFENPFSESTLIYGRLNNPNARFFEEALAPWENAESCTAFTSGMAAIFSVCFELLNMDDLLLYSEPLYGGTSYLFKVKLPEKMNIKTVGFKNDDFESKLRQSIATFNKIPKIVFIETPANPSNELVDIKMCSKILKKYSKSLPPEVKPLIVVDNTFLGPVYQKALDSGADISIYSTTKYIGGHSNAMGGASLGTQVLMDKLRIARGSYLGNILSPDDSTRMLEGIQELKERMTCQVKNAVLIAKYLNKHPKVEKVYHLSLLKKGHPHFKIYKKQCWGSGGVISFDVRGSKNEAYTVLNNLRIFKLAVSLGGIESLAEHPYMMTHRIVSPEDKERLGITEKMLRLSIGTEHPHDLIKDLEQALEKI